jgi:hypothetical protein
MANNSNTGTSGNASGSKKRFSFKPILITASIAIVCLVILLLQIDLGFEWKWKWLLWLLVPIGVLWLFFKKGEKFWDWAKELVLPLLGLGVLSWCVYWIIHMPEKTVVPADNASYANFQHFTSPDVAILEKGSVELIKDVRYKFRIVSLGGDKIAYQFINSNENEKGMLVINANRYKETFAGIELAYRADGSDEVLWKTAYTDFYKTVYTEEPHGNIAEGTYTVTPSRNFVANTALW